MRVLICSPDASLALSTVQAVSSALGVTNADEVHVATAFNPASGLRDMNLVASVSGQGQTKAPVLAALAEKVLVPGGKLAAVETGPASSDASDRIQRELIFGGLTEPSTASAQGTSARCICVSITRLLASRTLICKSSNCLPWPHM